MNPLDVLAIIVAALAAAFNALAVWILRVHWGEITELRKARHVHGNILTEHTLRLDALDGGGMRRRATDSP